MAALVLVASPFLRFRRRGRGAATLEVGRGGAAANNTNIKSALSRSTSSLPRSTGATGMAAAPESCIITALMDVVRCSPPLLLSGFNQVRTGWITS